MPFVGIIEVWALPALCDLGMLLADTKKAAQIVRAEFDDPYAIASKRIATDGVTVSVRLADDSLVHASDKQGAIREVLDEYLRYIEWSDDGSPKRLNLSQYPASADVVIDPPLGWGARVLDRNKVKIDDIVALGRAGESIKQVADEYDLTEFAVEDSFERQPEFFLDRSLGEVSARKLRPRLIRSVLSAVARSSGSHRPGRPSCPPAE